MSALYGRLSSQIDIGEVQRSNLDLKRSHLIIKGVKIIPLFHHEKYGMELQGEDTHCTEGQLKAEFGLRVYGYSIADTIY